MPNKQSPFTVWSDLCDAWAELFYGQDRGKIYDLFNQEKEALVDHLDRCASCQVLLEQVDPMANVSDLKILGPHDFAQLIRALYIEAQKKLPPNVPF